MKRLLLVLMCATAILSGAFGQGASLGKSRLAGQTVSKKTERQQSVEAKRFAPMYNMEAGETLQEAVSRVSAMNTTEELTPVLTTNKMWGTVFALDPSSGEEVSAFYTLEATKTGQFNEYFEEVTFTIYDNDFNPKGHSISFSPPDRSNSISMHLYYSKNFWNTDATIEYMFCAHHFVGAGGPENQQYTYLIYDQNGTLLKTLEGVMTISEYLDTSTSWNPKHRVTLEYYGDYYPTHVTLEIFDARSYFTATEAPEALHTLTIESGKLSNISAPYFGTRRVNNTDYYYFLYYELPFWSDPYNGIYQEDNSLIVDFYKWSDNTLAKSFKAPVVGGSQNTPKEAIFGIFFEDYDVTVGVFDQDDKWDLIMGGSLYDVEEDDFFDTYFVINEDGDIIKSFDTPISEARKLTDVPGTETQYGLVTSGGISIELFNLPSWEFAGHFDAVHNEELLTSLFDRIPLGDSKYAFVVSMYDSFEDEQGWYSKVNWYNPDGTLYKEHRFYMTGNDYFFEAQVSGALLNPYLFNTDDKMEYVGFCYSVNNAGGSDISMRIYNEDSEQLFVASPTAATPIIRGGIYSTTIGKSIEYLYVSTSVNSYSDSEYKFYRLPLFSFESGGSGTAADPYIITSAGDLDMVRSKPLAYYELANDIDMSLILNTKYAGGWNPIPFSGGLDGKGYSINNLVLNNPDNGTVSLFEYLGYKPTADSYIKNLNIKDAQVTLHNGAYQVGVLVGEMSGDEEGEGKKVYIENCHVTADFTTEGELYLSGNIGGLAGSASYYASIRDCSFEGNIDLDAEGNFTIGGIAGKLEAFATLESSFSKGAIIQKGSGAAGGIAGQTGNWTGGTVVRNVYSTMDVSGESNVGGVVGSFGPVSEGKGLIENAYTTGTVEAFGTGWGGFGGGVIGSTSANWEHEHNWSEVLKLRLNQSGLVALNDRVTSHKAHRIAGESSESQWALEDYGMSTLDSIRYTYALADMIIGAAGEEAAISSDDATSVEGADITREQLTEAFYTSIGWEFGEATDAPWVYMPNGEPRLYFEFFVRGISLNENSAVIDVTETLQLTATFTPVDARNQNLTWSSSDDAIASVDVNGLVTGLKYGTATITATSEEGGFVAVCEVKVGKAESISLNESQLIMGLGGSATLVATVLPEGVLYTDVEWESSYTGVATVDANGLVGAVAAGNATITARIKNSDIEATCEVTVYTISLNKNELELERDNSETLTVAINPADGAETVWTSSDNSIATVSAGGVVLGVKVGTCTITATISGTDISDVCDVTVVPPVSINNVENNPVTVITANDYIKVSGSGTIGAIRVYNAAGGLVYNGTETQIPTAGWSKGMYVVRVMVNTQAVHIKTLVK